MTIMGATFQLIPVIIVAPLRATRFIHLQYPLYLCGVILLLSGFWWGQAWLLIIGGICIVTAVIHYVLVLAITLKQATTHPITMRFLIASLLYLSIVVCLGLTAALNREFWFLGASASSVFLIHITLGVLGWLSCTLIGVSYQLVRMFALAHAHTEHVGKYIFIGLHTSIIMLATWAIFFWLPLLLCGGLLLICTFGLFAYDFSRMFKVRQRKILDVTQFHSICAVTYGVLAFFFSILALFLGWGKPFLLTALGIAVLVGWIGQSTIGYQYKIVPFLVWNIHYGPQVGRQKVPLMRDLLHERWMWISFWLINGGLPLVILCAVCQWTLPLQVSGALVGLGLLIAAMNIMGVALHLLKDPSHQQSLSTPVPFPH
ncbi:hypothetical protein KDA_53920 [Dictyobacter alpinus]|uniref:Uncharacterized protein n=2 Tax=Dictyobacter alpinus TaxID=2014873 RepID=A0A402BEU1_9CHLR|nr:hypothetical protein KDA_53920 [Dictyobacter alpinus]